MKEGRPSQTASLVAFLRALADLGFSSVPGFQDPTARHLLAPPWSTLLRFVERRRHRASPLARQGASVGVDQLALRTVLIDAYLREALARGVRQVVILGAGLDGRAYRIQELSGSAVFEVDHPATQTSFFIWEGVVMYLTDFAVRSTLQRVSARAAPGSGIVVNYATPGARFRTMNFVLRLWSEPMIGERPPDRMKALLEEAGFMAVEDTGIVEWAQRFGAQTPQSHPVTNFRVMLAHARGSGAAR